MQCCLAEKVYKKYAWDVVVIKFYPYAVIMFNNLLLCTEYMSLCLEIYAYMHEGRSYIRTTQLNQISPME